MQKETLEFLTACLQLILTIGAGIALWFGFQTWKIEYLGKKRIELVEDLVAIFFEVRDKISMIRSPWVPAAEIVKVTQANPNLNDNQAKTNVAVIFQRMDQASETISKFQSLKYRIMATFGEKYEDIFNDVNKQVNKIAISAHMLGTHYWGDNIEHLELLERKKHFEERSKHESNIWEGLENPDVIKSDLKIIFERIETLANTENEKLGKFWKN